MLSSRTPDTYYNEKKTARIRVISLLYTKMLLFIITTGDNDPHSPYSSPIDTCWDLFRLFYCPNSSARASTAHRNYTAHECMHGRDGYVTLGTFTGSISDAHQEPMGAHEKCERILSLIFFNRST